MTRRDIIVGSFWGLGAAAWHSVVPNAVHLLQHIPAIELVFFRNLIGMTIFLSIVCWKGFGFLKTERIWAHFQRNFYNFIGMWLWFIALAALPIATAVSLHFTVPLMVVVLAIFFEVFRIACRKVGENDLSFNKKEDLSSISVNIAAARTRVHATTRFGVSFSQNGSITVYLIISFATLKSIFE